MTRDLTYCDFECIYDRLAHTVDEQTSSLPAAQAAKRLLKQRGSVA
jgi:hypothetical protein